MMVYGHQASAAQGAYFAQKQLMHDQRNYLAAASARRLPSEAGAAPPPPPLLHQQPQPQLPQLTPTPLLQQQYQYQQQQQHYQQQYQMLQPPPLLKFQGVCDEANCGSSCDGNECNECDDCDMAAEDSSGAENAGDAADDCGGGGSGFLYSLLTAQDAAAVQQCSAFLGGTVDQFPRRSQSVSVPARRGSAVLPSATLQPFAAAHGCCRPQQAVSRPSSAPRGLRGPYGGGSAPALTGAEEPLDLSGGQQEQQLQPESIIEQQQLLQQQHQHQLQQLQMLQQQQQQQQPMLRNMLSVGALYQMPQLSPQPPALQEQQQEDEQPVRLAKKTVLVAQSHVADWLKKGADLVRTNGALFGTLDKAGRADLLCRAWPRILQLYMLEHNFQFAVSPAATTAVSEASDSIGVGDRGSSFSRQPTRTFADELQRQIAAAALLPFDTVTYNLMRLAAIFTPDPTRPDAPALAEVQSEILKHIYHHLSVKGLAQHFKEAEALLEAVSITDKTRLEILFCSHLSSSVDEYIRSQLR